MSLASRLRPKGRNGFGYGSTAEDVTDGLDLSGRTYLITGATSGIGMETMRVLALRGATVIAGGRTERTAEDAAAGVVGTALPVVCDLTDPSSILACVDQLRGDGNRLDAIICNAGVMSIPELELACGYELQFFNNHLGHFILVSHLLGSLADDGRVVVVSSNAHKTAPKEGIEFDNLSGERGYRASSAYGQSKLANLLFAKELARRLSGTGKTANAVHPGVVKTNLAHHMSGAARAAIGLGLKVAGPMMLKTVGQGAATQSYVATQPAMTATGEYFADCKIARPSAVAEDPDLARRLWEESERISGQVLADA